jgi:hypothetical protein
LIENTSASKPSLEESTITKVTETTSTAQVTATNSKNLVLKSIELRLSPSPSRHSKSSASHYVSFLENRAVVRNPYFPPIKTEPVDQANARVQEQAKLQTPVQMQIRFQQQQQKQQSK